MHVDLYVEEIMSTVKCLYKMLRDGKACQNIRPRLFSVAVTVLESLLRFLSENMISIHEGFLI